MYTIEFRGGHADGFKMENYPIAPEFFDMFSYDPPLNIWIGDERDRKETCVRYWLLKIEDGNRMIYKKGKIL